MHLLPLVADISITVMDVISMVHYSRLITSAKEVMFFIGISLCVC